ncbi:dihydrofolate synthase / folylpolyglutamate synthase [Nitrosomonas sp. Nm51]|uniref:bifunctional tetrahydrofolate synthase/dihydrofolate synthase n=1 Tax=Nitrosomonas sp. Nm51 TaxID=133720 RepID=UPI0008BC2A95|nr:bifunctional tetrahydrofolate synthase/dihydrofolate synthase [Nitrosomonas sp. Nm51]SEQ77281.1 dihydrofolate synthase / folylpolyglutamate synthase [Nitrosomonas sp. Nm51]
MHIAGKPGDLTEWLDYLEKLHPKSIDMGLERVDRVRNELRLTPFFPVIVVGGTNGKGSVCAIMESILTAADYRVGCYTSPHLIRYNERIHVKQQVVSDAQLLRAFNTVEQARKKCDVSLTYFEFGTLAAMHVFMVERIDVAILEVGLGGRLDAVNIFDADCAILTNVELDHQEYLGDSREAIGYEKAGIFRREKPVVCAEADLPLSVLHHAQKTGAQINVIHQDFGFVQESNRQWQFWSRQNRLYMLPLPALRGSNQLHNASACLMALEQLREQLQISIQAIREGLLCVTLPGRFQLVSMRPMIILDVAHNPAAAAVLAKNLEMTPSAGKTYAVFAMLQDKDIAGVVEVLKNHIDIWLISSTDAARGAHARQLLQILYKSDITSENNTIREFENVISAYAFACEQADKNDRICVFGSFFTVGAVLQYHGK